MRGLYRHEALPYEGPDEFVPSCLSLVREGLARDERVIVLAAQDKIDDVRAGLDGHAKDVTLVATDEHGRNPSRITAMLHSYQAAGDGRQSMSVNETAFVGRSPAAQAEARLADLLLNDRALRSWRLSIVCLYDTRTLDEPTQRSMRQCHSVIRGAEPNAEYLPDLAVSVFSTLLEPPPADAQTMTVTAGRLAEARTFVRAAAAAVQLRPDRVDDLVLAANEIVTNSLRYGGGRAEMGMWFADGAAVCDVRDRGRISDPLAGRLAPGPAAKRGRGLWLVNHLCDLVQLRSSRRGTVVRMFVER